MLRILPLFALAFFVSATLFAADETKRLTLAHIKLSGAMDEAPTGDDPIFGGGSENFKSKLERIRKAKLDPEVKGLLLQVEGLSVGWGKMDELRTAIAEFRAAGKKAYAYMESAESHDYLV